MLPYISEKTAALIIEYRQANGGFKTIDELLNIKGIGEKKLEKMKPYIRLE
jgi:competence ComEA-like helix-hairpin-helix protein